MYLREIAAELNGANELFAFPVGPVPQIACVVEIGENYASQCKDVEVTSLVVEHLAVGSEQNGIRDSGLPLGIECGLHGIGIG